MPFKSQSFPFASKEVRVDSLGTEKLRTGGSEWVRVQLAFLSRTPELSGAWMKMYLLPQILKAQTLNAIISRAQYFFASQALLRCYLTPMYTLSCWSAPGSSAQCGSFLFVWLVWFIPICVPTSSPGTLPPKQLSPTLTGDGWRSSHVRPHSNHCGGHCHSVSSLSCFSMPLSSKLLEHRAWAFHFHLPDTEHIFWGKMDLQWMFGEDFNQLNSSFSCSLLLPSGHMQTSTQSLLSTHERSSEFEWGSIKV